MKKHFLLYLEASTFKIYDTDAIIRNVEFPGNEREFDKFLTRVVEIRDGIDVQKEQGDYIA